jgi:ribonuclease HIII
MKQRLDDADEAPEKLSTYTIKLGDAQLEKLRAICEAKNWEPFEVAYARFAFRGPDVNVTAYDKRRIVVIAGQGTEEFVLNTLETEVTGAPRLGYDEVLHPERFEPHAGLDESGKGDFFGPVIAATVIADKPAIDAWLQAGVKDSKRLADSQILKLDGLIKKTPGAVAKTCYCGMPKYNELMLRPGANLNRLLAWQHATALEQALNEKWVPWGLLDQFSKQPLTQRELAKKPVKNFELKMRPRAEEDPVVAAASVVARRSSKNSARPRWATSPSSTSAPLTRWSPPRAGWPSCRCPNRRNGWNGITSETTDDRWRPGVGPERSEVDSDRHFQPCPGAASSARSTSGRSRVSPS